MADSWRTRLLGLGLAAVVLLSACFLNTSHERFYHGDSDYAQHLRFLNTLAQTGRQGDSLKGIRVERFHLQIMAPVYALAFHFPRPVLTLYLLRNSILILASAFFLAQLTRPHHRVAILLFFAAPTTVFQVMQPFNNLATDVVPLAFASWYCFYRKKTAALFFSIAGLVLLKEYFALIGLMFGLLLLCQRQWQAGGAVLAGCLLYLAFFITVYLPLQCEPGDDGRYLYAVSGSGYYDFHRSPGTPPTAISSARTAPDLPARAAAAARLVGAFALPSLGAGVFTPFALVPIAPLLLLYWSGPPWMTYPLNYYQAVLCPWFFLSGWYGVRFISRTVRFTFVSARQLAMLLFGIGYLASWLWLGPAVIRQLTDALPSGDVQARQQACALVPREASVMASPQLLSHLFACRELHYPHYRSITEDYLVLDLNDRGTDLDYGAVILLKLYPELITLLEQQRYRVIFDHDNILVLQKGGPPPASPNPGVTTRLSARFHLLLAGLLPNQQAQVLPLPRRQPVFGPYRTHSPVLDLFLFLPESTAQVLQRNPDGSTRSLSVAALHPPVYRPRLDLSGFSDGELALAIIVRSPGKPDTAYPVRVLLDTEPPALTVTPRPDGTVQVGCADRHSRIQPFLAADHPPIFRPLVTRYLHPEPPYDGDEPIRGFDSYASSLYIAEVCGRREYDFTIDRPSRNGLAWRIGVRDAAGNETSVPLPGPVRP